MFYSYWTPVDVLHPLLTQSILIYFLVLNFVHRHGQSAHLFARYSNYERSSWSCVRPELMTAAWTNSHGFCLYLHDSNVELLYILYLQFYFA